MNVPDLIGFLSARGGPWPVVRMDYDSSSHVIYIGIAPRDSATSASAWKIFSLTYSGDNVVIIQSSKEDQVWDNRATTVTYG